MDAFSRLQFCENNGKLFNNSEDIPTIQLTQGCVRDWLGDPIPPIPNNFHNLSPAWGTYDDDAHFMTAHKTRTNEFQTLLPINFCKKGLCALTPPNGTVITTSLAATGSAPHGTEPMMMLLESTLLGPAAGTDTTGRRLIAYQVQMPTKRNKTDNSKITKLSETLEIVYEGTHELLGLQEGPTPIDITVTMTWVTNKRSSGVCQRYKNHPYLQITMSFDSKGNFDGIQIPESIFWRKAYHKLLRYQLKCPALQQFGMDRDPAQYLTNFMCRAKALINTQTSTAPVTNLQRHSFLLDNLLGRTGNATDQPLGIPISWISDASAMQTLQATARASLPTANPNPNTVARLPVPNPIATSGHIDWLARQAEPTPEKLEDNPLGRHILDTYRRKLLQEEIDRQAPASSLLDAPMNEAKGDALKDLEIDINNLDQQRSEYQRLQAEADRKPAAKPEKSNDDGDKKMPAKRAKSSDKKPAAKKKPPNDDDEDKKMPASTRTQVPPISRAEATQWLRKHKAKVSIEDGSVYADCPIPPQVQQWLDNERSRAAARRQLEATPSQRPTASPSLARTATSTGTGTPTTRPTPPRNLSPWSVRLTSANNREEGKQDQEVGPTRPVQEGAPYDTTSTTSTLTDAEDEWLRNNVIPWLSNNDITLNEDGSYHSDSTIPPLVQQWLNLATYRHLAQEDYATGFRHL